MATIFDSANIWRRCFDLRTWQAFLSHLHAYLIGMAIILLHVFWNTQPQQMICIYHGNSIYHGKNYFMYHVTFLCFVYISCFGYSNIFTRMGYKTVCCLLQVVNKHKVGNIQTNTLFIDSSHRCSVFSCTSSHKEYAPKQQIQFQYNGNIRMVFVFPFSSVDAQIKFQYHV